MKYRIQSYSVTLSVLLITIATLGSFFIPVAQAQNRSSDAACDTLSVIDGSDSCTQNSQDVNINSGLEDILNLFSFIAGVIAVLIIMIAGLRYITSQGDSQKVSQAKNAIIFASIGLIVVALAQLIIRFILGYF